MALVARLRTLYKVEKCLQVNLFAKNGLSALPKPPYLGPPKRSFTLFSKPSQRDFKIKDDVPDSFILIYRNTMSKYILGAQIISLIAGGSVLLAFMLKPDFRGRQDFETWSHAARATENEELFYITFFVIFLVLMQVMVSRTPVRIYKVPQTPKYISVSYGNYLFGKEKYAFKRGEVTHLEETGFLPWKGNRFAIESETDRRTVILLEHFFRRPADLNIMLGEQKDPELEQQ